MFFSRSLHNRQGNTKKKFFSLKAVKIEFFGFNDMKKMTQSGRLLSGKSIDPKAYQDKKES
jgi:hypothetical protein